MELVERDPDLWDILRSWMLPWITGVNDPAFYLRRVMLRKVSTTLAT